MGEEEVEGGQGSPGQPQVSASLPHSIAAVRLLDGFTFVIYEFWETEEEWKRWVQPRPWVLGLGLVRCAAGPWPGAALRAGMGGAVHPGPPARVPAQVEPAQVWGASPARRALSTGFRQSSSAQPPGLACGWVQSPCAPMP